MVRKQTILNFFLLKPDDISEELKELSFGGGGKSGHLEINFKKSYSALCKSPRLVIILLHSDWLTAKSTNLKTSKAEFGNDVTVDLSKVAAVPIDFDFQLHSFNNGNFRIQLHSAICTPPKSTSTFIIYLTQSIWVVK